MYLQTLSFDLNSTNSKHIEIQIKIAKVQLTFTKLVQYAMRHAQNFKLLQNVVLIMFQNSTYTTTSIS